MTAPSPALRATVLQALADALMDQYPGIEAVVADPDAPVPPGARRLPAALPANGEPLGDVRVPRPRRGRRDDHGVDQ